MATLLSIAYRDEKRGPMKELPTAEVTLERGVHTDSRGKTQNHRQVTVLTKEGWDAACTDLGSLLPWTTRRANLLVEGLDLENTTGKRIIIGELELEVTGELDPCDRMDEQVAGLKNALTPNWRGGVTCRLLSPGTIKVGYAVTLA